MRKYRNITNSELTKLGVVREWDESIASRLRPGAKLLWIHYHRKQYTQKHNDNKCFIRSVEIINISEYDIITNFGKYSLQTGRSLHSTYKSIRPCDCYGRLYLPKNLYNV
ncbi:hypothetical protein [Sulfurovum mangrovi]|uniref:hypothetical protein n=1 Tax=Sulfurovum mangrovi TaxID=2893889 RepID=UPI001E3768A2|nr:hypothetical protein [Sulfurovum mangrovi]UFH58431.1 hypothetical protein LN246_08720 [Sulfurovum mangrovi]